MRETTKEFEKERESRYLEETVKSQMSYIKQKLDEDTQIYTELLLKHLSGK